MKGAGARRVRWDLPALQEHQPEVHATAWVTQLTGALKGPREAGGVRRDLTLRELSGEGEAGEGLPSFTR